MALTLTRPVASVVAVAALAAGLTGVASTADAAPEAARPKVASGKSRTGNTVALVARPVGRDWRVNVTTNPRAKRVTIWWNCGTTRFTTKSRTFAGPTGSVLLKSNRSCRAWASAWWTNRPIPMWHPDHVMTKPRVNLP